MMTIGELKQKLSHIPDSYLVYAYEGLVYASEGEKAGIVIKHPEWLENTYIFIEMKDEE